MTVLDLRITHQDRDLTIPADGTRRRFRRGAAPLPPKPARPARSHVEDVAERVRNGTYVVDPVAVAGAIADRLAAGRDLRA